MRTTPQDRNSRDRTTRYRLPHVLRAASAASLTMILGILASGCPLGSLITPDLPPDALGPDADAGRTPRTFGSNGEASTTVVLDGSATTAGRAAIVSWDWLQGGDIIAVGSPATAVLPVGDHEVTLRVTDADGRSALDTIDVTVTADRPAEFPLVLTTVGVGTTEPPSGTSMHPAGAEVVLRADAAAGYWFRRWTGDFESEDPITTFTLDAIAVIFAEFEPITASDVPCFFLPWAPGETRSISPGMDPAPTQIGFQWYVPMPAGTPIVSGGAGRVVIVQDSAPANQGGATQFDESSYHVIIDHGGGYTGIYAGLDHRSATVAVGQRVAVGQVIGYSDRAAESTIPALR